MPSEQTKIVLCDLDGTLASSAWRDHLVEGKRKNWTDYYKGIPFDNIIPKVKSTLEAHVRDGCHIVYITAREELLVDGTRTRDGREDRVSLPIRKWTEDWLHKHSAPGWPSGATLLMRKHKDHRPSSVVKEDMLIKYLGGNKSNNVVLALDDNESVINMYRRNGIENAILVTDPGVSPSIQDQHDAFTKNLPVARLLAKAASWIDSKG